MDWREWFIISYLIVINFISVIVTVHDKKAAKKHKRRISEKTLMILAALSGCVCMYITMRIIHHKTKHPKFMIGIPVIFVIETICLWLFYQFTTNNIHFTT